MRRRPGIAGLQTAAAARDQYRLVGQNVAKIRTDLMKELATFRSQLEEFARKYKQSILGLSMSTWLFISGKLDLGVLVGQAWQEGRELEQVPKKFCGEILMVKEYNVRQGGTDP